MREDMIKEIKTVAVPKKMPDGTSYHSISVEQTTTLANRFNVRDLTVEISALEADIVPERYSRNMKTYSTQDQATLLKSMVSVVCSGISPGLATNTLRARPVVSVLTTEFVR